MSGTAAVEMANSLIEFNKVHKDLGLAGFHPFESASSSGRSLQGQVP